MRVVDPDEPLRPVVLGIGRDDLSFITEGLPALVVSDRELTCRGYPFSMSSGVDMSLPLLAKIAVGVRRGVARCGGLRRDCLSSGSMRSGHLVALIAFAVSWAFAPSALAAEATSMTMLDERGGGAEPTTFTPSDSDISVSPVFEDGVAVTARRRGEEAGFTVAFTAPSGAPLKEGVYVDAVEIGTEPPAGRPGVRFRSPAGDCGPLSGRFEIRDLARGPGGVIERLWIVYEMRCVDKLESSAHAVFGEVRVGVPVSAGPLVSTPAVGRWAQNNPAQKRTVLPVTVHASAVGALGGVSVAGSQASDFEIVRDGCSNVTLAAGGSCQVAVAFTPSAAGTREAVLRVPGAQDVALQGWEPGGTTRVVLNGVPGDGITGGRQLVFEPATSRFRIRGEPYSVTMFVVDPLGQQWRGDFSVGCDRVMVPGTYTGATRWPFRCDGPTMDVTGPYGCNGVRGEFTVTDARHDVDGRPIAVGIGFAMRCDDNPQFTGSFDFRAGETVAPAKWMKSSPEATVLPTTTTAPSASPTATTPQTPSSAAPEVTADRPTVTGTPSTDSASKKRVQAAAQRGLCAGRPYRSRRPLVGTIGADRLVGDSRANKLFAGAGADRIFGGRGNDCLDGGAGSDAISGGPGRDVLIGGSGNDTLDGGSGIDVVDCGAGRDVARVDRGERTHGCERVTRRSR